MFGTYKCLAENCMGSAASEATLVGIDDETTEESVAATAEAATAAKPDEAADDILEDIDVSAAFATAASGANGKSVMLSMADVPDISAADAKQIVEMFAEELAETITDSNMVELPPLRFVKETSKAEKVNMEAVVIDIDEQEQCLLPHFKGV